MSTEGSKGPQKVNLRRPDIMTAVQAQVLSHYRSQLVEQIRANGHVLASGDLTVKLAKEFGFCYGVERAIDLAYAARRAYPDRRIFLLGEIIHNPEVNDQIRRMGIVTIAGKPRDEEIGGTRPNDWTLRYRPATRRRASRGGPAVRGRPGPDAPRGRGWGSPRSGG